MKEILSRLKSYPDVKGVYLHVLASNKCAIKFYEILGFGCYEFIPHYYTIMGHFQNAYCYILYLNDGQPPPSPIRVRVVTFLLCLAVLVCRRVLITHLSESSHAVLCSPSGQVILSHSPTILSLFVPSPAWLRGLS